MFDEDVGELAGQDGFFVYFVGPVWFELFADELVDGFEEPDGFFVRLWFWRFWFGLGVGEHDGGDVWFSAFDEPVEDALPVLFEDGAEPVEEDFFWGEQVFCVDDVRVCSAVVDGHVDDFAFSGVVEVFEEFFDVGELDVELVALALGEHVVFDEVVVVCLLFFVEVAERVGEETAF